MCKKSKHVVSKHQCFDFQEQSVSSCVNTATEEKVTLCHLQYSQHSTFYMGIQHQYGESDDEGLQSTCLISTHAVPPNNMQSRNTQGHYIYQYREVLIRKTNINFRASNFFF